MDLQELRVAVEEQTKKRGGYWEPHAILARATEELGELARQVNHRFGPKRKKGSEPAGDLGEEVAGIIYALVCLCNSTGVDLESALKKEIAKYEKRDKGRFRSS